MKKFLTLLMILGLAFGASGALIVTIEGIPAAAHDPIILEPSDTIEFDLELTDGSTCNGYTIDYVIDNLQAEWDTSGIAFPEQGFDFDGKINTPPSTAQLTQISAGNLFSPPVSGPILMNGLLLHCLEATDVLVTVVVSSTTQVDGVEIPIGTVLATVPITQIPEPMTIALLGLGGLLLRRRK
jgi:hypothetical protein